VSTRYWFAIEQPLRLGQFIQQRCRADMVADPASGRRSSRDGHSYRWRHEAWPPEQL